MKNIFILKVARETIFYFGSCLIIYIRWTPNLHYLYRDVLCKRTLNLHYLYRNVLCKFGVQVLRNNKKGIK
jgi:hypothetical protein